MHSHLIWRISLPTKSPRRRRKRRRRTRNGKRIVQTTTNEWERRDGHFWLGYCFFFFSFSGAGHCQLAHTSRRRGSSLAGGLSRWNALVPHLPIWGGGMLMLCMSELASAEVCPLRRALRSHPLSSHLGWPTSNFFALSICMVLQSMCARVRQN